VIPRNYLLFACHATNATAQLVQEARFVNYWHLGGREKKLGPARVEAEQAGDVVHSKVLDAVNAAKREAKSAEEKARK
jgi:hypothetical protein